MERHRREAVEQRAAQQQRRLAGLPPLTQLNESASRNEVVATFLAMLEMIRLAQIQISQADAFGDITITPGEGEPEPEPEPIAD